jgi:FAD/FMN-containing dehydrogenase
MTNAYQSWGRYPKVSQRVIPLHFAGRPLPCVDEPNGMLCHGLGRSYGDSCLNHEGVLLATRGLDHFIAFDRESGRLRCEAGVSLKEVLKLTVPEGWFLPVTPGTSHVTIGGAIANDVHGKNHHKVGTFGNFVTRFGLVRSDGTRLDCSPESNHDWFRHTIGGLGLTGLIEWAEFRLKRISNSFVDVETIRFGAVEEFFALSAESEESYDYLVAWVDGTASGKNIGRGMFMRGNHNSDPNRGFGDVWREPKLALPFNWPSFVLNWGTVRAFNELYYRRQFATRSCATIRCQTFFYPLDAIHNWNRMYGRRGFLQWQCLVSFAEGLGIFREILRLIANSRLASFLGIMKTMGSVPSYSAMSFSGSGVTLALDFPVSDESFHLLSRLNDLVLEARGRIYPAKDACISSRHFQAFYPCWVELERYRDPRFSSSFWRRVTQPA